MTSENAIAAVPAKEDGYAKLWKFATVLSQAPIVPKHYRNEPGNVFVAADYARHMDLPLLAVMQGTFVVSGTLGWTAAFLIARTNQAGPFDGPLRYEEDGKGGIRATAKIGGEVYTGPWVSMQMAQAEGWTKNPKYKSMPETMLRYRAATLFIRQTCPEVMMGLRTVDELEDMDAAGHLPRDVQAESAADAINAELEAASEPEGDAERSEEDAHVDALAEQDEDMRRWAQGEAS